MGIETALMVGGFVFALRRLIRRGYTHADRERPGAELWEEWADKRSWRFVRPMRIVAVVQDVEVVVDVGQWSDGGPSTRVSARRVDPSRVGPREKLDALRAQIPRARITDEGGTLRLEWDTVERSGARVESAIEAIAEACRWSTPFELYR